MSHTHAHSRLQRTDPVNPPPRSQGTGLAEPSALNDQLGEGALAEQGLRSGSQGPQPQSSASTRRWPLAWLPQPPCIIASHAATALAANPPIEPDHLVRRVGPPKPKEGDLAAAGRRVESQGLLGAVARPGDAEAPFAPPKWTSPAVQQPKVVRSATPGFSDGLSSLCCSPSSGSTRSANTCLTCVARSSW